MLVLAAAAQFKLRLDARITFEICEVSPKPARDLGQLGAIAQGLGTVAVGKRTSDSAQVKVDTIQGGCDRTIQRDCLQFFDGFGAGAKRRDGPEWRNRLFGFDDGGFRHGFEWWVKKGQFANLLAAPRGHAGQRRCAI